MTKKEEMPSSRFLSEYHSFYLFRNLEPLHIDINKTTQRKIINET